MVGFGAKRQILIVGNDGVHLYVVSGKRVSLYADLSQSGASLGSDLRTMFKAIDAPLTVLFDVVEQQYRRETLPKVSFFDKNKVIQRKLMMAFPQQQFRAFFPLQQVKRDENITAIFAGLSSNLTITQIMDAVLGSEVTIQGFGLLPMEATTLAKKLVEATHKRAKTPDDTRWSILMTHHATGGLRQVVIKDGELALTRLTPLAVDAQNTQALTEEMVREFNATLTYLSRFGYVQNDGLDLIVISSSEVAQTLRDQRLQVTHLYPLSIHEAGKLVGITPNMRAEDAIYGEIIHAGWVGTQRKQVMQLSAPAMDKVMQARQFARLAIFVLIFGIGYLGWTVFSLQATMMGLRSDITEQKTQRISLQNEYDTLSKQLNKLKYEPEKTKIVLDIYDEFQKKTVNFEPMLNIINSFIDKGKIILKNVAFKPYETEADPNAIPVDPTLPAAKPIARIDIELAFVEGTPVEEAARLTNGVVESLKGRLPGRDVSITEMVGNLSVDKTVQGVSEQVAEGRVEGRLVKEQTSIISITGAIE